MGLFDSLGNSLFDTGYPSPGKEVTQQSGQAALQGINALTNTQPFMQDKMDQVAQGFNMSLQNAQQANQPELYESFNRILTKPVRDAYRDSVQRIKEQYSQQGFGSGSTYEAVANSLADKQLQEGLLTASDKSLIDSYTLANQLRGSEISNAATLANIGRTQLDDTLGKATGLANIFTGSAGREMEGSINTANLYQNLLGSIMNMATSRAGLPTTTAVSGLTGEFDDLINQWNSTDKGLSFSDWVNDKYSGSSPLPNNWFDQTNTSSVGSSLDQTLQDALTNGFTNTGILQLWNQ